MPDECVLLVLATMAPAHLATIARACRRLWDLSGDDTLWRPIFERYASANVARRIEHVEGAKPLDHGDDDMSNGTWVSWKERTRLFITTVVNIGVFASETNEWAPETYNLGRIAAAQVKTTLLNVLTPHALAQCAADAHCDILDDYHVWLIDVSPSNLVAFVPLRLLFAHGEHAPLSCRGSWWEALWVRALPRATLPGAGNINLVVDVVLLCRHATINAINRTITGIGLSACAEKRNATPVDLDDPSSLIGMWYRWDKRSGFYIECTSACGCPGSLEPSRFPLY